MEDPISPKPAASRPQRPAAPPVKIAGTAKDDAVTRPRVERVVAEGNVVEAKKGLGRKFMDLIKSADAKGTAIFVARDVVFPAIQGMIYEAGARGLERIMYPEGGAPQNSGPRRIYGPTHGTRVGSVSFGGYRPPGSRPPTGRVIDTRVAGDRSMPDYVIASRTEADTVIERMGDLIDQFGYVLVADLHDLIGIPPVHTDNLWGWTSLRGVGVRSVTDGFLITLPDAEPVDNR